MVKAVNIFFDVDYTIMGADGSLRHNTEATFKRLVSDGHRLFVWSGVGVRSAEVRRFGLSDYVDGVFQKPLEDYEAALPGLGVSPRPDFVIDDHPEIVRFFGGFVCRPYYFRSSKDTEMDEIYRTVRDVACGGGSEHSAYRAPGSEPRSGASGG